MNEGHLDELLGPAPGDALADGLPLVTQPMVNQVQLHTRLAWPSLIEYCRKHRIVPTAFCPVSGSVRRVKLYSRSVEHRGSLREPNEPASSI